MTKRIWAALALAVAAIEYGTRSRSFFTSASENLRPIRRFTA